MAKHEAKQINKEKKRKQNPKTKVKIFIQNKKSRAIRAIAA